MDKRNCLFCNHELHAEAQFCGHCGTPAVEQPNVDAERKELLLEEVLNAKKKKYNYLKFLIIAGVTAIISIWQPEMILFSILLFVLSIILLIRRVEKTTVFLSQGVCFDDTDNIMIVFKALDNNAHQISSENADLKKGEYAILVMSCRKNRGALLKVYPVKKYYTNIPFLTPLNQ